MLPFHVEKEGVVSPLLLVIHIFWKEEFLTHTLSNTAPIAVPPGSNFVSGRKGLPVYHEGLYVGRGSQGVNKSVALLGRRTFRVKDCHFGL